MRRAALALALLAAAGLAARAQVATLCAEVKLEILQEATLEREAFDASLKVNNNLPDTPLTNLRVTILIKDEAGAPADPLFFIKLSSLTNTNAIDGSGVVQSSSTAEVRWLIIPSTGAGGALPAGRRYSVRATISGLSGAVPQAVTTFDDFITVKPQPSLRLQYVLPFEVFGDEPLTQEIEPVEPFALGVRLVNAGYGTARDFKIDSAQPKIVENKQGLDVDFKLLGTVVSGRTVPNSLLIPFGDVPPGGAVQASWLMSTTLSGRFVSFQSSFTHAAELGGQLTSLLESVTTYTLVKEVRVALPGRDEVPDFLVDTRTPRSELKALLDSGRAPPADLILESDQPEPIPVASRDGTISGPLGGGSASLVFGLSQVVAPGLWVYASAPFPDGERARLVSAVSADGRLLDARNAWVSKHADQGVVSYRLNLLDLASGATAYVFTFDPATVDMAPGAVTDLVAATGETGGSLALSWTAPGEDGDSGAILGGRYLIQSSLEPSFNPESAQVRFATSTAPGRAESRLAEGLVGNATHYFALWTQDTGGSFSALSNAATAYARPYPPSGVLFELVGSSLASGAIQLGNNALPIQYQVSLTSAPSSPALAQSPLLDPVPARFSFETLSPNATYYLSGLSRNPDTGVLSAAAALGAFMTLAEPPGAAPFLAVSSQEATAQWTAAANPAGTQYRAQLSTSPDFSPVFIDGGWTLALSQHFTGLAQYTTYYARAQARNAQGVETAYTDLGSFVTLPPAPAPVTDLAAAAYRSDDLASGAVALSWSFPEDSARLELRYSSTTGSYETMERQVSLSTVGAPGEVRSLLISGLERGASWTFALRYGRALGELSLPSNAASARTLEALSYGSVAVTTTTLFLEAAQTSTLTVAALSTERLDAVARAALLDSELRLAGAAFSVGPAGSLDARLRLSWPALFETEESSLTLRAFSGGQWSPVSGASWDLGADAVEWNASELPLLIALTLPDPQPLALASIAPSSGENVGDIPVTVEGAGFRSGATLSLSRQGGAWAPAASMSQARLTHGAFVLPSGKVLVAGGGPGGSNPTPVAELFDPAAGTWSPTGSLSVGRYAASYAQFPDGRVMIFGGFIGGTMHATAELYNPASGVWSPAGALPNGRFQAAMASLADGRVLLAGGRGSSVDYDDSFLYDPASNAWTPAGTMSHRRGDSRAVRLADGRVLVVGGVDNNGSNSSDLYDPATGAWSAGPFLNQGRYSHTITLLADGRVLVTGGTSNGALDSAELYDPAINAWTLTPPMPQPRAFHRALRLSDGRVLLFGDGASPSSVFYDPAANAWTPGPDLSMARSNLAAALLADGRALALGGWGNGRTQETVETLGAETIAAQGVAVLHSRRLTGTLPLAGKPGGLWNVVVANPDGASASLPNGFEVIVPPPPSLESVFPSSGVNTGTMTVTLAGAHLRAGASFKVLQGASFVDASSVAFISSVSLSGILDLTGAPEGLWSVAVTNPDGQQGDLPDAFLVYPPDLTPPTLFAAEVSADGLAWSSTATTVIRSTPAWARVRVEDAGVGLIGPDGVPAPSARFTSDAGATWTVIAVSSATWELLPGGAAPRGPYRFSVAGLPLVLAAPAGSNRVEWTVHDAARNAAVVTTVIPAALPLPTLSALSPDAADDGGPVAVTATGTGFQEGASMALSRAAAGPWTAAAPMSQRRLSHGAFLLPSGKLLVAGGGAGGNLPTRAAELYDPAAGAWSLTGALATARYLPSMAQLPDGRVLVVGGFLDSGSFTVYSSAELYDPATGVWTPAGALPNGRYQAAVATLADGRVLLAGGRGTGSVVYDDSFIYDPASNAWTPAGAMSHPRGASRAVRLRDGRVIVVGGVDNNGSNSSDLFDPSTGRWSPGPFLNQGRYSHTATLLADGRVLVTGGTSNGFLDTAEVFDPAGSVWRLTARMPQPRAFHQAQLLGDGRVLLFGDASSVTSVFYDPASDAWASGPDLSMARSTLAGFALPDGRVLALGGWGNGSAQETVEVLASQRVTAAGVARVSPERLTGAFDLTGRATGYWDLSVVNPDGQSAALPQAMEVYARLLLEPTTGPIGTAFMIRGAGLGAFQSGVSRVLVGAVPAPVASWTDAEVSASAPGVSPGAYAVTVELGSRPRRAGTFTVLLPEIASVAPAAAKAGSTLTVSGTAFGAYAEGLERLRVGLSTAAVSSWSDREISAILAPDAAEGRQAVWVERASLDGGLARSATASVLLDFTAPVSTLSALTASRVVADTVYAATTSWRLSAYDPVPAGEASGVASLLLSRGGGDFLGTSGELTLVEGAHDISFLAVDAAGNRESTRTARVVVDLTPPAPLADLAAVEVTTYSVRLAWTAAVDDAQELLVEYSSGAEAARLVLPLAGRTTLLVEGLSAASGYSFALRTRDLAGNLSSVSTAAARTLALAASPDGVATLVSPEAAIAVVPTPTAEQPGAYTIATSSQGLKLLTTTFYELSGGPVAFSTPAVLTFIFDAAGVDLDQVAIYRWNGVYWDSAPVSAQQLTLLADGSYRITGLLEHTSLYGVFERLDIKAPRTTLAVGEPRAEVSGRLFVTSASPLTITSLDDLLAEGDGVGLGVALQELSVAGSTRGFVNALPARAQPFSSSFTVTGEDGVYALSFFARDLFGNRETARAAEVELDNAAPSSDLAASGPLSAAASTGTFYASTSTVFVLSARDAGSGAALTELSDGGGAFQASAEPFRLVEGTHALLYRSADRLGNLEVARGTTALVDAGAPVSTAAVGGPLFVAADGALYGSTSTVIFLSAADPDIPGAAGSGVAALLAEIDGAPAIGYTAPLSFSSGSRSVAFHAEDRVGNTEAPRLLSLRVDGSAPETSLVVGAPRLDREGLPSVVGPATPLSLSSADPGEPASGVAGVSFRLGSQPFLSYTAPFTAAGPDGLKEVEWSAVDNVGNAEAPRSAAVALDATAPVTTLAMLGGRQHSDGASFYASSTTLFVLPAGDPEVGGVASGVESTEARDNEGAFQPSTAAFALPEGAHALGYRSRDRVANVEVERSTTILVDATPPVSAAHVGAPLFVAVDGTNYITPATPVTFTALDPAIPGAAGSGAARIEVSVDGGPFAAYGAALAFAEGRHAVLYRSMDNVGNAELQRSLLLQSDNTPPASRLVVASPQFQLPGVLLVSSRTLFTVAAVDPVVKDVAAGVKETLFRVGGGTFAAFLAPFTLPAPDQAKQIEFFGSDNVGNVEAARSSAVLLDSTPPELALASPPDCIAGVCRVLKGRFPVLGSVRDPHLRDYRLEAAPGRDADSGFVLVSSGGASVSSGTLGVWDASALSGWQTLRLTAADQVENGAVLKLGVFIGDPGELLILGNHDVFNLPEGVAVGRDGRIYVADRNNDRVAVFSATGTFLASFGDHHRHASTATLRLNKPSAVAVDAGDNILVADTNNDRVLKLSPAGQVLLELGRRKADREDDEAGFKPGKGPGEFHKPAGVAAGAGGAIYVSDAGNRRVQVFSSTGTYLLQFPLPPARVEEDDDDDKEEGPGKPFGIAVDGSGSIYVADGKGRRALKFDPAGKLLLAFGGPDRFKEPYGIAVTPNGDCVLVSDKKLGRILKFDSQGGVNLAFGRKGKDDEKRSQEIALRKPAGLALDGLGNLYVADRNNERVRKLGLPTGEAPLIVPPPGPEDEHIARGVVEEEEGGEVSRKDKAGVVVPAGALAEDLKITVSPPGAGGDKARLSALAGKELKAVSAPVEYGPHGTEFAKAVTLVLPYSEKLAEAHKTSADALKVHYWNENTAEWEALESKVDLAAKTVTAKTKHFSLYQVLASSGGSIGPAAVPAADPAFVFRDLYVYPNPARGGSVPKLHLAVGVADKVSLRVFDAAGREVHRATLEGRPAVIDDGSGAKYAYEHAWEGHIPSGVYLFIVEAEKAGAAPIRKAGRFGVVR